MAHKSEKRKKDREWRHAVALLRSVGEDPTRWIVKELCEKPDFALISPEGEEIGLELTELIAADCGKHGKHRAAEHAVAAVVRDEVQRFLGSGGIPGARIRGHNRASTPVQKADLEDLRGAFRQHLEVHGNGLLVARGCMRDRFEHKLVVLRSIHRSDRPSVRLDSDMSGQSPPYSGSVPGTIEEQVVEAIQKKWRKAAEWRFAGSLWLAIRNPSDEPMVSLLPSFINECRNLYAGGFRRIILFNDPEHVVDPCPALPRCVEIV